ncbi:MAG: DUF1492 domain-containing protein, partial [Clostridia bacterium]|nr:DUF1492 domain-containing protein [Clostridia bacterium]
ADTEYATNKMIELTERKISLINLKLIIENILNELSINDTKLLILKYVDRVKGEDIAKKFNVSNRTFFRRSNTAMKSFELGLKRHFKNHNTIFEMCKKEAWIIDLFNKLYEQELQNNQVMTKKSKANKADEVDETSLVKFAQESYKKINCLHNYA